MKTENLNRLKNSLPSKPGIQLKDEYMKTAVMVLLILLEGEYHFVFQKRNSRIRQGGEICFPGGVHDPERDRTLETTALRETIEEMGIPAEKINIIGRMDTFVSPMGATVDAVVGIAAIESLDEISINKNEVEEFFTVPVSYFEHHEPEKYHVIMKAFPSDTDKKTGKEIVHLPVKELGLPDIYSSPWEGGRYNVYVYTLENTIIWGITARFIKDFIRVLKTENIR